MKNYFELNAHRVTIKSEIIAALTSFFAAVYIIIVNANILSDAGIPIEPLIIATAVASFVGCLLVAFISNTPLIVMPGMGINALFVYTIVNTLNLNFYEALTAVVISGIIFFIITITPLSKVLTEGIPINLKEAITVGIGLFITFIGLQKAGIVIGDTSTLVKLGNITDPKVLLFIIIMILTIILFLNNIPGAFLLSIIIGTILARFMGIIDFSDVSFSLPDFNSYKTLLFHLDFTSIATSNFWIAVFSLTLVLVFENIGLLHGQVDKMLKAPEKTNKALGAVALSVIACGLCGTSPSVSTVEGTAGIAEGGRTGLTAVITGLLLLLSIFFIPIIRIIPDSAIAPILIVIGCLMVQNLSHLNFVDLSELFPAFITIVTIPLTYSIVDGIAFGFILYPICKIFLKKWNDISLAMAISSLIFLIYFILK